MLPRSSLIWVSIVLNYLCMYFGPNIYNKYSLLFTSVFVFVDYKLSIRGVIRKIFFLISPWKHILWVLIRITLARCFYLLSRLTYFGDIGKHAVGYSLEVPKALLLTSTRFCGEIRKMLVLFGWKSTLSEGMKLMRIAYVVFYILIVRR